MKENYAGNGGIMIKAVIFDMDGVIIDSEPLYLGWYRKFLEENNIFVEDREFNKIAGAYAKVEEELLWAFLIRPCALTLNRMY